MRSWRGRRTRQWPATTADTVRILSRGECLDIIAYLAKAVQSDVTSLANTLELHLPAVSLSLNRLRKVGWVRYEKDAKQRIYTLGRSIAVERLDQSLRISIEACDGSCITIARSLDSCGHSKTVSKTDTKTVSKTDTKTVSKTDTKTVSKTDTKTDKTNASIKLINSL